MTDHFEASPKRLLKPYAAVAIIVGIVVGAGIFKTPSMVAGVTGDIGWALLIWVAGAVISLAGALCYAELSTTYPHAGGDYHFLTRAYGMRVSFLYAWAKAMVINTGSIALLAFVFGDYMTQVIPLGGEVDHYLGCRNYSGALSDQYRRNPRLIRTTDPADSLGNSGASRDRDCGLYAYSPC